jgi:sensor c-di-GMP phosphodiesterase-like protein
MMRLRVESRFSSFAVAGAAVIAFVLCGHFAANALIEGQRAKQLSELSEIALRRSESAIDFGAATLAELATGGRLSCDAAALQAVRLHVYQRGAVKDIRLVNHDGQIQCSAYSETLEFDKVWATRADMLPSTDGVLHLFRVEQFFGIALGVMRDIDDKNSLVAILGINEALFDIMPSELRDHSSVVLTLGNGQKLVDASAAAPASAPARFNAAEAISKRYPLQVTIRADEAALWHWNREPYVPIMALATLLGLAFGGLLARSLNRSQSPTEEIDRALAAQEFKPYLQPIFDLRTRAIVGGEILARWVRNDGQVLPPSRFIALAEANGRIEPMTWAVLSGALAEAQPLLRRNKDFKLSVNVVPRHLVSPGFVDALRRVVVSARVSPRQIVLELTERQGFEDLSAAATVVAGLRDHGFRVALDDVGIGQNGLSHIQKLGAGILKIDKFFVDSVTRDPAAAAVIDMLVRLARELKMVVVAEGIEDESQLDALAACGVEQGQGYIVSPAVPLREFIRMVEAQAATPPAEPARISAVA